MGKVVSDLQPPRMIIRRFTTPELIENSERFILHLAGIQDQCHSLLPKRVAHALQGAVNADDNLLSHPSPLGWEHINLTGDYS